MACDLCGKKGTELIALCDTYKTAEVAAICSDCEEIVNKRLRKLQSWSSSMVVALMGKFFSERVSLIAANTKDPQP